jgi:uncharacterized protein
LRAVSDLFPNDSVNVLTQATNAALAHVQPLLMQRQHDGFVRRCHGDLHLIAVGGLSGTGKSLLARSLAADAAPAPGAVVLRSDVERKALFGAAETERLPQTAYTPEATETVYASLAQKARRVIGAGHSAIVDAVFARAGERTMIAGAAGRAAFHGLFLTADLAVRIARVGGREGDASDADAAVARTQESYDLGTMDWTNVDASGMPEDARRKAKEALKGP